MKNELAFKDRFSAMDVAEELLDEDYVVMLSREEQLTIVNYEWAPDADRNYVVFGDKAEFEEQYFNDLESEETSDSSDGDSNDKEDENCSISGWTRDMNIRTMKKILEDLQDDIPEDEYSDWMDIVERGYENSIYCNMEVYNDLVTYFLDILNSLDLTCC